MSNILKMNPRPLNGVWKMGWALDLHTLSSEFVGYDEQGHEVFDTTRSDLGEAVYQAKYKSDKEALVSIALTVAAFLQEKPNLLKRTDVIVPMPPSKSGRSFQPVILLATEVGKLLAKTVDSAAVQKKRGTRELKNVKDYEERSEILENAFTANASKLNGRGVLLLDDLYRSGATANAVAKALYHDGGAASVYFVAVTKTRSNR
ncbi:MAG: ComF family protein [Candidatus Hydrogenedentes bacterium]|nr:ComF family protein [Candidatus Hydrogenedentota bacterium]